MSQVVVLGFDTTEQAQQTVHRLRDLEKAGQISIEDTAIVSRDEQGNLHTHNGRAARPRAEPWWAACWGC